MSERQKSYVEFARQSAVASGVPDLVRRFVTQYNLRDKRMLEVGAGSGLLQDLVSDYTGLDISPTARRFFHKPFVEASATAMPFPDESFDGLWSIWVLEHIPNPERALREMRRVVKPGGYMLLWPAWEVSRFAAQGYAARPYSDFDWKGKLIKAVLPVARSPLIRGWHAPQGRLLRSLGARIGKGPSRLHFTRLEPNYGAYWEADSDATTSVSLHEVYLWFVTRGDECLNCPPEWRVTLGFPGTYYMVVKVKKR